MNLTERIDLAVELGRYMTKNPPEWQVAKEKAGIKNTWFTEQFVNLATNNIVKEFLQKEQMENWVNH